MISVETGETMVELSLAAFEATAGPGLGVKVDGRMEALGGMDRGWGWRRGVGVTE